MVRILRNGPSEEKKFKIECNKCQSLLEYSSKDIESEILYSMCKRGVTLEYIFCPNCKRRTYLKKE